MSRSSVILGDGNAPANQAAWNGRAVKRSVFCLVEIAGAFPPLMLPTFATWTKQSSWVGLWQRKLLRFKTLKFLLKLIPQRQNAVWISEFWNNSGPTENFGTHDFVEALRKTSSNSKDILYFSRLSGSVHRPRTNRLTVNNFARTDERIAETPVRLDTWDDVLFWPRSNRRFSTIQSKERRCELCMLNTWDLYKFG